MEKVKFQYSEEKDVELRRGRAEYHAINKTKLEGEMGIEKVYEMARGYAPSVMRTFNLPTNKFSAEDIVGQFIVNFIEKGFMEKYDKDTTSLKHYVYVGVRNTAISMYRHVKKETTSANEKLGNTDMTIMDATPAPEAVQDFIIDDLIEVAGDLRFGYGRSIVVGGVTYESKGASVLRLIANGYQKQEIAKLFGVTAATISNVLTRVRKGMKV